MPKMGEKKESLKILDDKKANPRRAQDSIVQTIPKAWWKMAPVRSMLQNATLFLQIRNGTLEILIRRDKEAEK